MRIVAALLALSCWLGAAAAHDYTSGTLRIEHPWARATAGNARNAAVYLHIRNDGAAGERLLRVESPVSEAASIHRTQTSGGVSRMLSMPDLAVPPGEAALLTPESGLHIMLERLTNPLKRGERIPLTLVFEQAGKVEVEVTVEAAGARGSGHGHAHH
jgi:periplasmic copper chaperone A